MKLIAGTGYAAVLGGLGTLGYQSMSTLMHPDNIWPEITLGTTVSEAWVDALINTVSPGGLQDYLQYLAYDMPLYQLLLIVGIFLVILGSFLNR